jgi:hypothetical protein
VQHAGEGVCAGLSLHRVGASYHGLPQCGCSGEPIRPRLIPLRATVQV